MPRLERVGDVREDSGATVCERNRVGCVCVVK